jgi:hypothetical protein
MFSTPKSHSFYGSPSWNFGILRIHESDFFLSLAIGGIGPEVRKLKVTTMPSLEVLGSQKCQKQALACGND